MPDSDFTIIDNTQHLKDEMAIAIEDALVQIGVKAERYAKKLTPVGTPKSTKIPGYIGGTLRNSITFVTSTQAGTTIGVTPKEANPFAPMHGGKEQDVSGVEPGTLILGTNVYYAPFVELGTSKKEPRPFLRPALENHVNQYKQIFQKEINKVGK